MTDLTAIRKQAADARTSLKKRTSHPGHIFCPAEKVMPALCDALDELTAEVERLRAELDNMAATFVNTSEYQRGFLAATEILVKLLERLREELDPSTCPYCGEYMDEEHYPD